MQRQQQHRVRLYVDLVVGVILWVVHQSFVGTLALENALSFSWLQPVPDTCRMKAVRAREHILGTYCQLAANMAGILIVYFFCK